MFIAATSYNRLPSKGLHHEGTLSLLIGGGGKGQEIGGSAPG